MNRFIRRVDRQVIFDKDFFCVSIARENFVALQVPDVYTLDCTNVEEWNARVLEPAATIVEARLKGEKPSQRPLNENVDCEKFSDSSNEESHWCKVKRKMSCDIDPDLFK